MDSAWLTGVRLTGRVARHGGLHGTPGLDPDPPAEG